MCIISIRAHGQSVGIVFFLLKCRFLVGIGIGFEMEKSRRFFKFLSFVAPTDT
jgi:hypothetical protein